MKFCFNLNYLWVYECQETDVYGCYNGHNCKIVVFYHNIIFLGNNLYQKTSKSKWMCDFYRFYSIISRDIYESETLSRFADTAIYQET